MSKALRVLVVEDEMLVSMLVEDMLEALDLYLCLCGIEELRYIGNILFLDVVRILVGSHRYIEFSTTIDSVESVEACTIQIDEPGCSLDISILLLPPSYPIPCTYLEVFFFRVFDTFEILDELFWF